MASPTTAMADGGAQLAGELATVEAETREERERGAAELTLGTHGGPLGD